MKYLFVLHMLFVFNSTWADSGTVRALQTCLKSVGSEEFTIKYYSEKTDTLVYENSGGETMVVKRATAYKIEGHDAAACKKIDLGDMEEFGDAIVRDVQSHKNMGEKPDYAACSAAMKSLKLERQFKQIEKLKTAMEKPVATPDGKQ